MTQENEANKDLGAKVLDALDKILSAPVAKDAPAQADVHVPNTGGKKPVKGKTYKDYWSTRQATKAMIPLEGAEADNMGKAMMSAAILKVDEDTHMVTGWASVIEENGTPVVDWQGDIMNQEELVKAAHNFMKDYRVSKAMHQGKGIGDVVESMVFTKELQAALGIDLKKVGWLIKTHVSDPAVWQQVKKGQLKAFSIGGKGVRTPVAAAA